MSSRTAATPVGLGPRARMARVGRGASMAAKRRADGKEEREKREGARVPTQAGKSPPQSISVTWERHAGLWRQQARPGVPLGVWVWRWVRRGEGDRGGPDAVARTSRRGKE